MDLVSEQGDNPWISCYQYTWYISFSIFDHRIGI